MIYFLKWLWNLPFFLLSLAASIAIVSAFWLPLVVIAIIFGRIPAVMLICVPFGITYWLTFDLDK